MGYLHTPFYKTPKYGRGLLLEYPTASADIIGYAEALFLKVLNPHTSLSLYCQYTMFCGCPQCADSRFGRLNLLSTHMPLINLNKVSVGTDEGGNALLL